MSEIKGILQSVQQGLDDGDTTYKDETPEMIRSFDEDQRISLRFLPWKADPQNGTTIFYEALSVQPPNSDRWHYLGRTRRDLQLEGDPLYDLKRNYWDEGTEEGKRLYRRISYTRYLLSNVWIIDDSHHPERNGTNMVIRIPAKKNGKGEPLSQIYAKWHEALYDEDMRDEFGVRIYDLSPDGSTFQLKVTKSKGYKNYESSRFSSSSDLGLDKKKREEILDNCYDLSQYVPTETKSVDEIREFIATKWHGSRPSSESTADAVTSSLQGFSQPNGNSTDNIPDIPQETVPVEAVSNDESEQALFDSIQQAVDGDAK